MAFDDFPRTVAQLRVRYRHLVWSNPEGASDDAYIGAALRRASFLELTDFYAVFGLERLKHSWQVFQAEAPETVRATGDEVERIFKNLQPVHQSCL